MRKKLGLFTEEADDKALIDQLLEIMQLHQADFTNTFRALSSPNRTLPDEAFQTWHERWALRLTRQPQSAEEITRLMQASNPAFIPRNHKVEEALTAAVEHQDLNVMQRLLTVLATPYDHTMDLPEYSTPQTDGAEEYQTFCGT